MFGIGKKSEMPSASEALPGRSAPVPVAARNIVTGNPMTGPFPAHLKQIVLGMGCFWGVERLFYQQNGVYATAVGYSAGHTPNPSYDEVCTGKTGHNEVVLVVYDPAIISSEKILTLFWENHDPTQGMQQGPDRGTQYRSGIYTTSDEQHQKAIRSKEIFEPVLAEKGFGPITTEILPAPDFFYAEDYHQQYLQKNPGGYCSMRGTGASCVLAAGVNTPDSSETSADASA
ncbi:MAG: peptide-methionine (S)-S-oxide reductase MsrA [Granulosicoccus sp.]